MIGPTFEANCRTRARMMRSLSREERRGRPRTLFISSPQRKKNMLSGEPYASDQYYGFPELKADGYPCDIFDDDEIKELTGERRYRLEPWMRRVHLRFVPKFPVYLWNALPLAHWRVLRIINSYDIIVCFGQTHGFCLAFLKRLGLVRPRVMFIVMGTEIDLWPENEQRLAKWLLGAVEIVPECMAELEYLVARLKPDQVFHYLPLGSDMTMWAPPAADAPPPPEPYVFSIGNDRHRDYETLIEAWKPEYPKLKLVTRLPINTNKANVDIMLGDASQQILTYPQVRELIQQSLFVILPTRDTLQPSGQSASMSVFGCGKALVLSRIRGLWEPDLIRDGETCLLTEPSSVSSLRQAVERLLSNPAEASTIGAAGRKMIEENLTARMVADIMRGILVSPTQ
jgi:glycosyltransferase involved in cell wall biosynthesis